MTKPIEDGGPAFPNMSGNSFEFGSKDKGMTLRQYAAIKLKVPNSGTEWLDEMIKESLRDDFAGQALIISIPSGKAFTKLCDANCYEMYSEHAYKLSKALLAQRDAK